MISQGLCTSFKGQLLLGVHDFRASGGDVFKIALYSATATLNSATTRYKLNGEVTGTNYTAGGIVLTNLGVSTDDNSSVGFTSFSDATFTNVTLTARGAIIYNSTPSANAENGSSLLNPAVCVLDFGEDKTVTNQDFTVVFPTNANNTAIVRIT